MATSVKSAGGIILNTKGELLVIKQDGNFWTFPKGGIESNETPIEAARREILEESGIADLQLVKELGSFRRFRVNKYGKDDERVTKEYRVYLFTTKQIDSQQTEEGTLEVKWFSKNEAYKMLSHKKEKEFFNKIVTELEEFITK